MMTLSRRRFLQGTALLGAAAPGLLPLAARGGDSPAVDLMADTRQIEVAGRAATVFALRQADGRPGLTAAAGADFVVRLHNRLDAPTLVHWHGLTPPWRQDGVPGLSQAPLAPGESYAYRFALTRGGTHWMHSHLGLQEQALLAAPLIVRESAEAGRDAQEVVVLLHDFSFRPAEEILAELKAGAGHGAETAEEAAGGHGAMQPGAGADMAHGMAEGMAGNMAGNMAGGGAPAEMVMDLNDVTYDAYLANDRTLDDPEVVPVEAGGRVRLRLINGATATNFTVDLGGLAGDLVAVDGNPVAPLRGRHFPLAIAQRLDIAVDLPRAGGAFPLLFLREGDIARAGVVLAARGAPVERLSPQGLAPGPIVDLSLERRLRAAAPLAPRPAERTIGLDLTGGMAGYTWGLAQTGPEPAGPEPASPEPMGPLRVRGGERVEIVLRNRTMMSHPMHLHGHHFQVVAIDGARFAGARRDTVIVPPRAAVTIAFDADNPGRWAFHCHNLYHMAAGMMTTLAYDGIG